MHSIREGDRPDVLKRLAGHLFVLDLLIRETNLLNWRKALALSEFHIVLEIVIHIPGTTLKIFCI